MQRTGSPPVPSASFASTEARNLVALVAKGLLTAEAARELIGIGPQQRLRMGKILSPDQLERALAFRQRVLACFEELLGAKA